jgi:hypothetical protein
LGYLNKTILKKISTFNTSNPLLKVLHYLISTSYTCETSLLFLSKQQTVTEISPAFKLSILVAAVPFCDIKNEVLSDFKGIFI